MQIDGPWVCFQSTDDWLLPNGRMGGEDCDMCLWVSSVAEINDRALAGRRGETKRDDAVRFEWVQT